MRFSRQELLENRARLTGRTAVYRRYGYDSARSIRFVLSRALPLPGRVLEIGTGKGRFLVQLLQSVPRVTTIDLKAEEQRLARMNVAFEKPRGRARFVVADAADLPWRNGAFDSVVSMNALHHVKEIPRVLDEILRVVRPGGKIVLADFNERGFEIFEKIHADEGGSHERFGYNPGGVARHLRARGCNVALHSAVCVDVLVAVAKVSRSSKEVDRRPARSSMSSS
ncbi:MAG: class I SAM-dependent methyltransferase [Kiritimatiellae bacterium]|nr:class I SAM-dependent methyltransferase [Kiritimatiellia bacterium]